MNYGYGRLFNVKTVQYCSKLGAKLHGVGPSAENITSLTCRNYFQFCIRQGSENCPNISNRGFLQNVLLRSNRKSSTSSTRVSEQVLLYSHDNYKFLRMVNIFGLCFAALWGCISYQFATMRIVPIEERRTRNLPWFARFDLVSSPSRKVAATLITGLLGFAAVGGAWIYSVRTVGKIILERGGKTVTFTTYNPLTLSMSKSIRTNVSEISCLGHRSVNTTVPIKIRGRRMHYLLSHEGTYHDGILFDRTVGLKRYV